MFDATHFVGVPIIPLLLERQTERILIELMRFGEVPDHRTKAGNKQDAEISRFVATNRFSFWHNLRLSLILGR